MRIALLDAQSDGHGEEKAMAADPMLQMDHVATCASAFFVSLSDAATSPDFGKLETPRIKAAAVQRISLVGGGMFRLFS